MRHRRFPFIAGFLAAPVILYVVFVIWPYAQAFYISLTDWRGFSARKSFIGIGNYIRLAEDANFWRALEHNALILLVLPLVTIVLGLFFASLLNVGGYGTRSVRGVRGSGFYRILYFFPYVLPVTIAAILWQFIFNPRIGLLNALLDAVGLGALRQTWLGDPDLALWSVVGVMVWSGVGFYVVLFTAAIQAIPTEIYEAARIDGAGGLRTLVRITVPLLRDTVQVAYVYLGIVALDAFTFVQVMTPTGGPDKSTEVMAHYLYLSAFQDGEFGYASAMGVTLCVLSLLFAGVTFRLAKRERIEY